MNNFNDLKIKDDYFDNKLIIGVILGLTILTIVLIITIMFVFNLHKQQIKKEVVSTGSSPFYYNAPWKHPATQDDFLLKSE